MKFISTGKKPFMVVINPIFKVSRQVKDKVALGYPSTTVIANICLWFIESWEVPLKSICLVARISPPG